jgi:predicted TPR repeat methyltransferase
MPVDRPLQALLRRADGGDLAGAIAGLRALCRQQRTAERLFHLGTWLAERRDPEGLQRLQEAAILAPDDDAMANNLGHALREAGALEASKQVFADLIRRSPRLAAARYGLGAAAVRLGQLDEAERALGEACRLDPSFVMARRLRAEVLQAQDRPADALAELTAAVALDPRHAPTLRRLGLLHAFFGRQPVAVATLRQALALAPGDALAAHVLGALTGEGPSSPDDAYVVALFDAFAETFDAHLVDALAYRVPALVDAALEGPLGRVADLGCGTGLVGPLLRPRATWLEGVDLSPAMAERAVARGVYDAVHVGPIVPWLAASPQRWDTLVLADVIVYIGALDALWAALATALAPGGRVVATTEADPGDAVVLRPNGRYAHGRGLIDHLAAHGPLRLLARRSEPLRRDGGRWVEGELTVWG